MHAVHGSSKMLSGEWSSQSSFSIHLPQQNTEDIGETREGENYAGFKETYGDESTQAQGSIVKSGFLGRCDDPYCTTCPYEDWSETAPQTKGDRGNLIGKLKDKWVKGSKPFRSFPGIFSPHTKLVQRWNQLFAVSSLVAVFIDPLFFFIFSVEEDEVCISFNAKLAMVITILRSITDTLYFLHMLLQFRLAYIVPASKTTRTGILESNPKRIASHYLKGWFLIDFVAVIPLPQVNVKEAGEQKDDDKGKEIVLHTMVDWKNKKVKIMHQCNKEVVGEGVIVLADPIQAVNDERLGDDRLGVAISKLEDKWKEKGTGKEDCIACVQGINY